jgi:Fis family transcriptional regulator
VVLSQTGSITMNLLPINIRSLKQQTKDDIACGDPQKAVPRLVETLRKSGPRTNLHERIISRVEKALLQQVLEDNDYTQTKAAEELGLSRNTVRRKMKELGIETE